MAAVVVVGAIGLLIDRGFDYAERMRMTQVEVMKEYKDMEGDPLLGIHTWI